MSSFLRFRGECLPIEEMMKINPESAAKIEEIFRTPCKEGLGSTDR